MPERRVLLRPTRRRPRRRRRRRNSAPSRRDALPRQQALRGRVVLHMHLIQTLDAPRRVVAPQARVGAAPRPAVEARVVERGAATRVRRFTHQAVRGAPLRQVLEDQAAAGSVRPGSRPPLHHCREVELRDSGHADQTSSWGAKDCATARQLADDVTAHCEAFGQAHARADDARADGPGKHRRRVAAPRVRARRLLRPSSRTSLSTVISAFGKSFARAFDCNLAIT